MKRIGLQIRAQPGPGVLHDLTGVLARHEADIEAVEILSNHPPESSLYVEVRVPGDPEALLSEARGLERVRAVEQVETFQKVFGKRVIIIGGGAQVGQVGIGAISEADRHNIRGEHISVDTIPLVGEAPLAEAVRAVARLPRARVLVLAGALMGGAIADAVREVRSHGIVVISLNMAGSAPEAADLVVTDPIQAGVMAVMAIADTAEFDVQRLKRRTF
jgi:energy-converting hydrogenase B subunit Q